MIKVSGISKTFKIVKREKGLGAAFKALFKREYKYVKALDEVSFSIDEGEIVGYIGPNGAGKSTTIKVISGIMVPDSGEVVIDGFVPWKDRREYVKRIGVVFGQRTQLWWDVPIIDSFELLKDIYAIDDEIYTKNLEELIEILDLKDFINTPLRQLSLGQRMRAEIAASLLHNPKIIFLDEPTIGLDAISKIAVRNFIKKINKEKKITVILTTHDMNDIEALTDRIILIGKGKLLYDGSIKNLKKQYNTSRNLTVTFAENSNPVTLKYSELISYNSEQAVYKVDITKTTISKVIKEISSKMDVIDVDTDNFPLEELIKKLYEEYKI